MQRASDSADQGHDPRVAEAQGWGPSAVGVHRRQRDPLKGWARKDTALADPFSIHQTAVGCTGPGLQLLQVLQAAQAAKVSRVVDHGFNPQCPSFFEVLLDP